MRPVLLPIAAGAFVATLAVLGAQDAPQAPFRSAVDVIQLDVSVLDKERRPITGLAAGDFTVLENGKPQRIVTISEVNLAERDRALSAWMRHVPRDVAANDLSEQVGDGRLFAIVLDDRNLPADDLDVAMNTRSTGRYLVDQLGPSDLAAVVFVQDGGLTQDFTDDRARLIAAVDSFEQHQLPWVGATPRGSGPMQGDFIGSSSALMRSQCFRAQPAIPTLDTVVSRLATVPGGRKTVFFVSIGVPISLGGGDACQSSLAEAMKDVFRKAQRANININGIDPTGYRGYENYLQRAALRGGPGLGATGGRGVPANSRVPHDFLKTMAEDTGGRAVVDDDGIEPAIDEIFEEGRSYYLVGYETSNGSPDGKYRKVEVKVNRSGATARSSSGYWAPQGDSVLNRRDDAPPSTQDLGVSGMMAEQGVPLRVSAVPIGRADPAGASRNADVAVVLTVRVPPLRAPASDTLTVIRNVYDERGNPGPPVREVTQVKLAPGAGDAVYYDVFTRLSMAPGQYQIRFNAQSTLLDRSGSVYANVEVPDFSKAAFEVSPIALGTAPPVATARTDAVRTLLPIVPTSERDFAASQNVTAFLRLFQSGAPVVLPVALTAQVFDADDVSKFSTDKTIGPDAFDVGRSADYTLDLPLAGLTRGPYLLSVTARLPSGRSVRRDIVFRVR